jgi:hypothetical protein
MKAVYRLEVTIPSYQSHLIMPRQGGDPEIVGGNRHAGDFHGE